MRKIDGNHVILVGAVIVLGALRVVGAQGLLPLFNFTPLGAIALFSGAYFKKPVYAYLFPIGILFVSDLILMQTIYSAYGNGILYSQWSWTYAAFLLMIPLGQTILRKVSLLRIFGTGIAVGLVHWIVTDFGVWLGGGLDMLTGLPYTQDLDGFLRCYLAAIPWSLRFMYSTWLYTLLLFSIFEWVEHRRWVPAMLKNAKK